MHGSEGLALKIPSQTLLTILIYLKVAELLSSPKKITAAPGILMVAQSSYEKIEIH